MESENKSLHGKKVTYVMASGVALLKRVIGARRCEDNGRKSVKLYLQNKTSAAVCVNSE